MKFQKPDEKAIKRMTAYSIGVLIETLKDQRSELIKPYNRQIAYYEKLLEQKKAEEARSAEATS